MADELENILLREDKRGTPVTVLGNKITAEECRKVLNEDYPDLADRIEHYAGSYKDGKEIGEESYLRETHVATARGKRRPDLSWRFRDDWKRQAHLNTVSTRSDGSMIPREQAAYDDIAAEIGEDLMTTLDKLGKDEDPEEFRKRARAACKDVFRKWLGEPG